MTSAFIKETAHAWQIAPKKVRELASWTEWKVDPHNRAAVFAQLLRRHMRTYQPKEDHQEQSK